MIVETESRRAGWADHRPHLQHLSSTRGLCLRVLEEGRHGMVTTAQVDDAHLPALTSQALEIARLSPPDPDRRFGRPAPVPADIPVDDALFSTPLDSILEMLGELERKILCLDSRLKKVIRLQVAESRQTSTLQNTHAVSLTKGSTTAAFAVEVLAEEGGQTEVGWQVQMKRFSKDLSPDRTAAEVAQETLLSLGGEPLPSGPYAVVVHPRVGAQLLELLSEALSAEQVQLGRSFLAGRKQKPVAARGVTLVDDPFLKGGINSAPFDDEGTPHEEFTPVDDGVLQGYFYDLRFAAREGTPSNGHGLKMGLAALPRPRATNFYLKPGKARLNDMLASEKRVFLIKDVMGLHTADPMTGEFSLGASGYLYEKGAFKRPVRGVTIAGLLGDVLKKIVAVGDDLTWFTDTGSPSFLLSGLMVAGT